MKKSKIIVPALGMLLLSTAASVSGTVAWFAANDTVTATGMQVSVKSSSTFLLIGTGEKDTAAEIQADNTKTVALTVAQADSFVYPCAHEELTNTTTANTLSNWYTQVADAPNDSASTSSKTVLTTFENYVIKKTVYVTVATGSSPMTALKVSMTNFASNNQSASGSKTNAAVRVVVTSGTAYTELKSSALTSEVALTGDITTETCHQIDIFVYYDGNDSTVFTNNLANLDGAAFDLSFTAVAK